MSRIANVGVSLSKLERVERSHRQLAGRFGALKQALNRCHPETMTTGDWMPLRAALVEMISECETGATSVADYLCELREALDEHRDPRRDYSS